MESEDAVLSPPMCHALPLIGTSEPVKHVDIFEEGQRWGGILNVAWPSPNWPPDPGDRAAVYAVIWTGNEGQDGLQLPHVVLWAQRVLQGQGAASRAGSPKSRRPSTQSCPTCTTQRGRLSQVKHFAGGSAFTTRLHCVAVQCTVFGDGGDGCCVGALAQGGGMIGTVVS